MGIHQFLPTVLFVVAILGFSSSSFAQCGLGTTSTLSTQTQVNEFLTITYPDCIDFLGNLSITNNLLGADNITDLSPLNPLVSIEGDLRISSNGFLANLNGLNSITTIGGDIYINGNGILTNIEGLSVVSAVGGGITISLNDILSNLDGLNSISSEIEFLGIGSNDMLVNIDGLGSISSVLGDVLILNNSQLSNINGLNSISSTDGDIRIEDNNNLLNLDGLNSILSVNGDLTILNNSMLSHLDGLSSISTISGYLGIVNNDMLSTLNGLRSLTYIGGNLNIASNDLLSNIDSFCALYRVFSTPAGFGGSCNIGGNGYNPSKIEIINHGPCSFWFYKINTEFFTNLNNAINFAVAGDVIELINDATETTSEFLPSNVTILVEKPYTLTFDGVSFTNNGTYKGNGILIGNFINNGFIIPSNN